MATSLTLDITTTAESNVVLASGDPNHIVNGGFETFDTISPFLPSSWTILPTPPGAGSPVFSQETTEVFEGTGSLKWSHDGTGQRPSIFQLITVEDFMKGKTLKVKGRIKSSTAAVETLSMAIGINNASNPTLVLPNGSENDSIDTPYTGVFFNLSYDDQQWYEFDFYYHVPESGVSLVGPVFYPTAEDSTTEIFLDDIECFFELTNRSEEWRIDLEPINKLIYGYGYGYEGSFIASAEDFDTAVYDFFNVIGVLGTNEGVGVIGSVDNSVLPPEFIAADYAYAFGYEYAPAFLANKVDSIMVRATVLENNITQPGVRVVFKASPGVCFNPQTAITDSRGEVITEVSLDISTLQNTTRIPSDSNLSSIPFNGYLTVFAEIDRDPRENGGISIIRTETIQLTETALDIIDVSSYAFQKRSSNAYGVNDYGFAPPGVDLS